MTKMRDGQTIWYEFSDQGTTSTSNSPSDNLNRLKAIYNNFGQKLSFDISAGLVRKITDQSGRYVEYSYDLDNHLIKISSPQNTGLASTSSRKYGYSPEGLLSSVQDEANRYTIRNDYDSLGRVIRQRDAKDGLTTLTYTDCSILRCSRSYHSGN